jgi:putative mRNA 3-end processing factor
VVEATYGAPSCRRNFNVDVRELLVSMVEKRLRGGAVYVFGYHGKLQEIMQFSAMRMLSAVCDAGTCL